MDVITRIESQDQFTDYAINKYNRALCACCGSVVEAPVRVRIKMDCEGLPEIECVPYALLSQPEVIEDMTHNTPPGLHRVFSNFELEFCVEAFFRMEMCRQGITSEEALATPDR